MFTKSLVLLSCLTIAMVMGVPTRLHLDQYIHRRVTVTPNKLGLPTKPHTNYYEPKIRIPGYKTVDSCGPVHENSGRIVGGHEAVPHSFPWQVALIIDNQWFCGGSLISDEWVLTAAHCMDGAQEVKVIAGSHDLKKQEPSRIIKASTTYTLHKDWSSSVLRNDLSLIKLTPIPLSAEIQPVCLPAYSSPDLRAGDNVTATGWGKNSDDSTSISYTLNEVTIPVLNNSICASYYGEDIITDNIICINTIGGHGVCSGDSGGPLNYKKDGKYYTHGITSFGSVEGCQSGAPDGFTRVAHYLDWIETITGIIIDP